MEWKPILSAIILITVTKVSGYGSGAPSSQCGSLTPGHGLDPLDNSNSPYTVKVDKSDIKTGDVVNIEVSGAAGEQFQGFLVQVRDESDNVVGTFENLPADAQYLKCSNDKDTVTHRTGSKKTSIKLGWVPPVSWSGTVKVLSTAVETYDKYYVKLSSTPVTVTKDDSVSTPEPEPEPETEPEPSAEPAPEPEPSTAEAYTGCFKDKSCFGEPKGCESSGTCDYMFSWKVEGDKAVWEGYRKGSGYVGIGVSTDTKMGNDIMFLCSKGGVKEYMSTGRSAPKVATENKNGLNTIKVEEQNGNTYCKFESSLTLVSAAIGLTADMKSTNYYLLLARGDGELSYHSKDRSFTGEPVALAQVSRAESGSNVLLKVHGLSMLSAWIGCAGTGIIIARYFKQTWKGTQVLGKDLWFVLHQTAMGSCVLLTVIGFILVLIETQGWNYSLDFIKDNPHPAVGLATVILCLIQPLMAFFRPHPGTKYRVVFNWLHWFVGNSAFTLGLAAIFLAGDLAAIKIDPTGYVACLIVYVIVYTIVHLGLTGNIIWAEHRPTTQEIHPMSEKGVDAPAPVEEAGKEQAGSMFRKVVLLSYLLFSFSVAVALIVMVFRYD